MAGMGDIINLAIVGVGVYLAYSTGLLDKAGQGIVAATTPKGGYAKQCWPGGKDWPCGGTGGEGYAKHHRRRREVIVPYPIVEPVLKPRMRLTMA